MPEDVETREARWGERMVELKIRFWTDGLADGRGRILPKHAWTSGIVRTTPKKAHDITEVKRPFNSLGELGAVVERVLIEAGVKLHPSSKMRKLIPPE